ncbi:MAG: PDZ domain-containing protein [Acidobacteriota bacterium]|nr:PDZ domain-containing protein [Acidobacteriota bacterium]
MLKKIAALAFLLIATSVFAEDQIRRTVIVKNGEVLLDETDPPGPGGKRAFLGVSLVDLTPELRDFFGAPKDAGVLVSSVSDNGPAAKAGVRVGDIIASLNGKSTGSSRDLRLAMKDSHAGDSIRIEVIRGKSRQALVATAEEREMPEFRAFNFKGLDHILPPLDGEWHKRLLPSTENEELRSQIRALEKRLQELEKRLQK